MVNISLPTSLKWTDRQKYIYIFPESVQVDELKIIQHNYWSRRHENAASHLIKNSGKWLHNIMILLE